MDIHREGNRRIGCTYENKSVLRWRRPAPPLIFSITYLYIVFTHLSGVLSIEKILGRDWEVSVN
jgi:hypothetical protein